VELETGEGKAAVQEALFLYTLTPKFLDATRGRREEWFAKPATLRKGRAVSTMPPGATHGAFCLRDANNILITSEPLPSFQEASHGVTDSELLENGYAYKPGLFALIQLGQRAQTSAEQAGQDVAALKKALNEAKKACRTADASDEMHCDAIRSLRAAIRDLDGIPEAANRFVNRFPTDPVF
jgi:hypothetical protein